MRKWNNTVQLAPDEEVLGIVRRRWLVEMPRFLFALAWTLLPFFFFFPLAALGWFGVVLFFGVFASGAYALAKRFFIWRYTMLLITTDRVIDVDQFGFFARRVSELSYAEIDVVEAVQRGIFAKLFHVGRVHVETKEHHAYDLEISGIFRPEHVRDLILDVQYMQFGGGAHDQKHKTKSIHQT